MSLESHASVLQVRDVRGGLAWFRDAPGFDDEPNEDGSGPRPPARGSASCSSGSG